MLVVINNEEKYFYTQGMTVKPLEAKGDVLVVIDPSKTNMAVMVSSPLGENYLNIEFSGNNRGSGPVMDTTVYCNEVRSFLRSLLQDVDIYIVGIEAAITKRGHTYHKSDLVLKEIRGALLNFFLEEYGIRALEINNWAWKHAVLPEGYRSQSEKGSKRFICENYPSSPLCHYYEADMTDCFCMTMYVVTTQCTGYALVCNRKEDVNANTRKYWIYPNVVKAPFGAYQFRVNHHFNLQENTVYLCNRTKSLCHSTVDISTLKLEDIYGHTKGFSEIPLEDSVTILIERK